MRRRDADVYDGASSASSVGVRDQRERAGGEQRNYTFVQALGMGRRCDQRAGGDIDGTRPYDGTTVVVGDLGVANKWGATT